MRKNISKLIIGGIACAGLVACLGLAGCGGSDNGGQQQAEPAAEEDALVYEVSADGVATGVAPETEE